MTRTSSLALALAWVVVIGGIVGCGGGSSGTGEVVNTTGPVLSSAGYVDVDGNGVDVGDIVVLQFSRGVFLSSENPSAIFLSEFGESFGDGATQHQCLAGATRVEVVLGTSPSFVPGVTQINVRSGNSLNIKEDNGTSVRRAAAALTLTDMTATAPTLSAVNYNDADRDGTLSAGDTLLCEFDKPIVIPSGQTVAGNFTLPVTSDSFGTSPTLTALVAAAPNRAAVITLGATPNFTVSGTYDNAVTTAGSPTGVAMAASPGITDSLTSGANAVTGSTEVDLGQHAAAKFPANKGGDLFPGNLDGTSPDVSASGYYSARGTFHFNGSVTSGGTTFTGVQIFAVADTENHRVLLYDSLPTGNGAAASVVLGQDDFVWGLANRSETDGVSANANTMNTPSAVHFDATSNQLFVSDSGNHRILIFAGVIDATGNLALSNGQDADWVLGQSNFVTNTPNQGSALPSSRSLSNPGGLHASGGQLAVADTDNHRVLIWSTIPSSTNSVANTVLGQASFQGAQANGGGVAAAGVLNSPTDVLLDAAMLVGASTTGSILVADSGNNRVLVWETLSPASGAAADQALGQASLTASAAATTATGLSGPTGVAGDSTRVYVVDRGNHRVMTYAVGSVATNATGAAVGQANATTGTENRTGTPTDNSLSFPWDAEVSITSGTAQLFVADSENHRVLNWTTLPTGDASANRVQGQSAFTTSNAKGHLMNQPTSVSFMGGQLAVADQLNNRVLIFNSVPTSGDPSIDVVVGQADDFSTLENAGGSATAATLNAPQGVFTDGTRLVIADTGNNRVLIYNTIPSSDGATADIVLGQSTTAGTTANASGLNAATMDTPTSVLISGTQLLVSDSGNHRVLIFADITTLVTGNSASTVIGQPDFSSRFANQGSLSPQADSLDTPRGMTVNGSTLYICDSKNHRVLGFAAIPGSNGANANFALGQVNLVSKDEGVSARRFSLPVAVSTDGNRLIVSDYGNHRLVVYNTVVATTNPEASVAIGQSGFSTGTANRGGTTPTERTLFAPGEVFFNGLDAWVADQGNSRLVRFR